MTEAEEATTVAIIGAGVAGLALANLLSRRGVACVVLEKRSRAHVEQRQRAGVIDTRAVRMFRAWGLEERVVGGVPTKAVLNFRIDGVTRTLELSADDHGDGRFCPQRVLVKNLTDVFLADGGDLRYEVDVAIASTGADAPPRLHYRDRDGAARTIACDFIAGCDGDRGVSRTAIPADAMTRDVHDYGYAWLTVLAAVPATRQAMMAIHPRGFAGQFTRGPAASRFYLQCPPDSVVADWPDERIWDELAARFVEPMARGAIVGKQVVPIRGVVHSPMRHGSLFLLGDAAHIVPPMSAKGMNLALHDAEILANAVIAKHAHGDDSLLASYSATCLAHVWNYQAFATSFTHMIHDAGDASYRGEFHRQVARADFERLFTSASAKRLLGELLAGLA